MKPPKRASAHPNDTTIANVPIVGEPWNFNRAHTVLKLPASIAYHPTLTHGARLLWGIIRTLAWRDGLCYALNSTLAAKLGVKDRTLRDYCLELKRAGLMRESRRLKGSPGRELLWHPCFAADEYGADNPDPNTGDGLPEGYHEWAIEQGIEEPPVSAKSRQSFGGNPPDLPNLMSRKVIRSSSYAVGENEPVKTTRPDDDESLEKALRKRGCDAPGIRRAVKHVRPGFDWRGCLEYADYRVESSGGRITSPAAFYVASVMGAMEPPESFETSAKRAARQAAEAEAAAEQQRAAAREDAQLDSVIDQWRANDVGRYTALCVVAGEFSQPGQGDWSYWLRIAARDMLATEGNRPQCISEPKQKSQQPGEVGDAPEFRQLWIPSKAVE